MTQATNLPCATWPGRDKVPGSGVEAGAVAVNDAQLYYVALELPFGGAKASGLGSRHGPGGIRKYCQTQALMVTRFAPKKDVQMFPYKPRTFKLLGGLLKLVYGRSKRR